MRKLSFVLIITACCLLLPLAATAQTPAGFYADLHGGFVLSPDQDLKGYGEKIKLNMDAGWNLGGAIGFAFPTRSMVTPRAELEITYRQAGIDKGKWNGNQIGGFGDVSSTAFMFNAILDFDTNTGLYPYIGAGLGVVHGKVEAPSGFSDIKDTVFAYQGIIGVGYNITENWGATLDYRYTGSDDWKKHGLKYEGLNSHSVALGIRYSFSPMEW